MPHSGTCRIEADSEMLPFHINWQANGDSHAIGFAARRDGSEMPSEFPGRDSFAVQAEGPQTVGHTATASGRVILRALRRVSDDGTLMSVRQDSVAPDGTTYCSFQVYRRA